MPALTRLKIQKPLVHKLTINPSNAFDILVYYEMRGAGGGAGGGSNGSSSSPSYKKGGDGRHGTKVYGQIILSPGDSLYLCPGRGGQRGESVVNDNEGRGLGGKGLIATIGGTTYIFAGGDGGNANHGNSSHYNPGAGGGGGAASVIISNKNSIREIAAVAAGGGGGGGAGYKGESVTSDYPYIGSTSPRPNGGGDGQTHGDSTYFNYRYGSYLGFHGAGAGGGGGGARGGLGGIIDFGFKPSAPGSSGTSFSSKIGANNSIEIANDQKDIGPLAVLEQQLGGDGGAAFNDNTSNGTSGDNGYILVSMYPLNRVRLKSDSSTWISPDSFYYKVSPQKWSTIRKMYVKKGSAWNKFYDIDVYYNLEIVDEYEYGVSTERAIRKEAEPPPPPPDPPPYYPPPASTSTSSGGGGGGEAPSYVAVSYPEVSAPAAAVAVAVAASPAPAPEPAPLPSGDGGGVSAGPGCPGGVSAASDSSCSAGDGGGGKVICTELYRQGHLPEDIYQVDQDFGKLLLRKDPVTYWGYRKWADILVNYMQGKGNPIIPKMFFWVDKDKKQEMSKDIALYLAKLLGKPFAYELARRQGKVKEFSIFGYLLVTVGLKVCKLIGFFTKKNKSKD